MENKVDPLRLLEIRTYPDPILSEECEPVEEVTPEVKTLIRNMFATMYEKNGVGLSANQVGVKKRIFVMDTSNSGSRRKAFINPIILSYKNHERFREGCLSFPDVFAFVKRPTEITVSALDEEGKEVVISLSGIEAICFQHELDHLNGITFYDHLSQLQKNLVKKRIQKLKKK